MADPHPLFPAETMGMIAARETVRKFGATADELTAACDVLAESKYYGDRLIARAVSRQIRYQALANAATGTNTPPRLDLSRSYMMQMAHDEDYNEAHSSAVALGLVLLILALGAAVSAGLVIWAALPW